MLEADLCQPRQDFAQPLSSSRVGTPIQGSMRGEGLLRFLCALLIAAGATSCRIEVETTQPPRKTQETRQPAEVRNSPFAATPQRRAGQGAGEVGICDPNSSPVMIVVVESPRKVQSASALWESTPVVRREAETVVFSDGRIVTSKIEATGPLLQSLGWTHRKIEIVGGLPAASGAWQRRRG